MDEFKITEVKENQGFAENTVITENPAIEEAALVQEVQEVAEYIDEGTENQTVRPRRRQMSVASMAAGTVAAISAAAVGITGMLNVNMDAEFDNVYFDDGKINYSVVVNDMTEKENLSIDVYNNDDFLYTLELIDDNYDGKIDGSIDLNVDGKDTINYRLNLKGLVGLDVTRNFDSYVVKSERKEAKFEDLECWCNCGVDGYYYFKMNFEDNFGLFSDFSAQISDMYGNVSTCVFTENLHEPQKIYVMSLNGAKGKLRISYLVDHDEEKIIEQEVNF